MKHRAYVLVGFLVGWAIHFLLLGISPAPDLFDPHYQDWMRNHIIYGGLFTVAVMGLIFAKFGVVSDDQSPRGEV